MGLFTKERITFWKPFRIAIRFLIGFVIWTTCVHMRWKRRLDHRRDLHTTFLLRRLTHAWLQRAFPSFQARTNHVPRELCVHTSLESGFLASRRITIQNALFSRLKPHFKNPIWKSFAFTKGKRLSNQERVRITFRNGFRNVNRFFVNRPNIYKNLKSTIFFSCLLFVSRNRLIESSLKIKQTCLLFFVT